MPAFHTPLAAQLTGPVVSGLLASTTTYHPHGSSSTSARLSISHQSAPISHHANLRVSHWQATMLRTEGLTAFFAGLKQRTAYSGPLWALQFGLNARLSEALLTRRTRVQADR